MMCHFYIHYKKIKRANCADLINQIEPARTESANATIIGYRTSCHQARIKNKGESGEVWKVLTRGYLEVSYLIYCECI